MKFTFAILLLLSILTTYGENKIDNQHNTKDTFPEPGKKAIAIAGINSEGSLNNKILDYLSKVSVDGNYIQIKLSKTEMPVPKLRRFNPDNISSRNKNRLKEWLNANNTGQAILSQWFNRQPDGTFNLANLEESGIINARAKKIIAGDQIVSKKIINQLAGSPLNNTYLMVFNFRNVQTMEDYYDEIETESQYRILRGYIASVNTYIFKFDFNRSVANTFFNDYWIDGDEISTQTKQEAFNASEFPFFFVAGREDEIASVQPQANQNIAPADIKSNEELLDAMAELAVKNITDLVEDGEISFLADPVVRSTKPITAGIGAKDNLKFDQRFGVYENRIALNGKIKSKRISVVKSMKVASEEASAKHSSDYSAFYRIAGGKIIPNQMYLKRKYDAGINLYLGEAFNSLEGTTGRFEYYFSKAMDGALIPGKTAKGLTSVKLYFEAAQNEKSYLLFNQTENFKFTRGSIGIAKEYHPLPFMHWGPFVGYGLEYTTWEKSDYLLSTNFAEFGIRLGINLRHNVQIIGSATYYHLIKTVLMDDNRDVVNPDFNYSDTFTDRTGFAYSIGFRVML